MSKIDLFSVYLNQVLKVEKDVSAGKVILCLACYKNFNKFVRSDDSLNELSKTDGYLTKFFFPPPKSEYFFQQHWESEYFFLKKTIPPSPPPPFKLNGPSIITQKN
jgi:hypothetical protein